MILCLAGCSNMVPMIPYHYPKANNMPPVVEQSMESLLKRLEDILTEKAPSVASAMQPGLSAEEIDQLEVKYGVELSEDVRLLYQWHNGIAWNSGPTITPLHEFYPLEYSLERRAEGAHHFNASDARIKRMMEPILPWLPLFQDAGGDGYYFDPERSPEEGAVFKNFLEVGSYTFFPSMKNVIAGLIACYEEDCYFVGSDGRVDGDFEKADQIWRKYGQSSY